MGPRSNAGLPVARCRVNVPRVLAQVALPPLGDEPRILAVRWIGYMSDADSDRRRDPFSDDQGVLRGEAGELTQDISRRKWRRGSNEFLISSAHSPVGDDGAALRQDRRVKLTRPLRSDAE